MRYSPVAKTRARGASTIACAGHAKGVGLGRPRRGEGEDELMSDSVYRVTEVIGTSATSWEEAAKNAVETAAKTLRDLRVGEVVKFDVTIEDGKVTNYRARVNISFKYEA
jgi:dodecin